ncbi:hypothetical protein DRO53_00930 [Candidatus Bathyarchaeota archaeon]|nr:MAG: hypothetical protein DRO46_03525 [Candidatus Hecatellales archaeon]RLI35567.1 MAG: hypothetical protein DRO53_00930 [Candidatus Bathyarchaeota archaeon]
MKLKVDFHVHTIYSGDSSVTLEAAVQAALEAGLDGLAITDHDSCEALKKLDKFKDAPVLLLPGVEISSSDGHILALGLEKPVPPGLPAKETVEEIKRKGGVAVAAHPLCPFKKSLGEHVLREVRFDAVETLNASTIPVLYSSELKKLSLLAEELGLPQLGGSDSHTPETIGRAYTVVEVEDASVEEIFEAVRKGKTRPEGERIRLQDALNRLGMKLKQKIGRKLGKDLREEF